MLIHAFLNHERDGHKVSRFTEINRWSIPAIFLGLSVYSTCAVATEWSADTCAHIQEIKDFIKNTSLGDNTVGKSLVGYRMLPILRFLREKCGVDTSAEEKIASKAIDDNVVMEDKMLRGPTSAQPKQRNRVRTNPRLDCVTVDLGGMSHTQCN
jgi:hypothetical protein